MIISIFVATMTLLLPVSIYRTIREFKKERSMSVKLFGKEKKYIGSKAKYILYLNIVFQFLALLGIYLLSWDYLKFNF